MKFDRTTAALAAVIFVTIVAAYVLLELRERPTNGLLLLATPVLAALFTTSAVGATVHARTAPLQEQLRNVETQVGDVKAQTNGALDARIRSQTKAALVDAGLVTPDHPAAAQSLASQTSQTGSTEQPTAPPTQV